MTSSLANLTLEVADLAAAERFYSAFVPGLPVALRASQEATDGFRGFAVALTVAQPADVRRLVDAAVDAGATVLKPATKSFWGYGGVVRAPDGTIWKVASSEKKDTAPATGRIDRIVLLLGCADVAETRAYYTERGLTVAKSFGRKYVEFDAPEGADAVVLALYGRRALAKDLTVPVDGTGSHRLVLGGTGAAGGPATDPDGFVWEPAQARAAA
ncbi:glyoxalase [Streptomyces sp. NPDC053493]|uniref:glyoxalase n=1 Tax=Streptomyces sp. NPDC053493 TaxID=3365705 RepID=UPI0037D6B866